MMWSLLILNYIALAIAQTSLESESNFSPSFFVNHIFEKYGDTNSLTYEGFEHLLENLGLGRLEFEEIHDLSLHKINGTFQEIHDVMSLHHHSHQEKSVRRKRHAHSKTVKAGPCLSPEEILESYGLEPTHGVIISQDGFQSLCPAIIYELDQKHCWSHRGLSDTLIRNRVDVWMEASLSIFIMSVAGLLCAAVVPILNKSKGDLLLLFLVSVAAGTLAGDALIHLLPQALTYDINVDPEQTPLLRATVTLLSMLLLFIFENALRLFSRKKKGKMDEGLEELEKMNHGHSHGSYSSQKDGSLACIVIAGDILHNVTDGLSVGAAFSTSRGAGLACATAVFCHELPHELGDYAVLLKEGMGVRRALLCNLFSSIFSFGGMAAGLLLGEIFHASPWVNAFTAGSFLYIALANLVPELKKSCGFGSLLCQMAGLFSGILLMVFIGFYEDQWEHFLTS